MVQSYELFLRYASFLDKKCQSVFSVMCKMTIFWLIMAIQIIKKIFTNFSNCLHNYINSLIFI